MSYEEVRTWWRDACHFAALLMVVLAVWMTRPKAVDEHGDGAYTRATFVITMAIFLCVI